jgi:flagellar biosynthetic protein FliR
MNIPLDMHWIESVLLASVRMAAFIVIAPPFSSRAFPGQIKAMLALALGLAVSPKVAAAYVEMSDAAFFGEIIQQLLIGFLLGFIVFIAFAAVQSAGNLIDLFGGFQLAQGFDPQMNVNGAQFSRYFTITATALLLTTGAYQVILGGVFRSFDAIPIGAMVDLGRSAETLTNGVGQLFLSAIQIAGPLLIVLFLADAGLGLLTRVSPALNAFQLGFPLKIFLTLALGGIVFAVLPSVVTAITGTAASQMMGVK